MDNEEFLRIRGELNATCEEILGIKGKDYTIGRQDKDKLYNFREIGKLFGSPRLAIDVAAVYWLKHVFAIMSYIKTKREGSEPIKERFADCRNYIDLMWAIIEEERIKQEEWDTIETSG